MAVIEKTKPAQAPAQSTKPGAEAPAAKPPRPERKLYPGLEPDKDGKPTKKLTDYPKDFDPKVHKSLKRTDFENEGPLLEKRADELLKRSERLRAEANEARTMGNAAQRQTAKKLRTMREQIQKLEADLRAQGIDPAIVLGNMAQQNAAPAA